jgi:hypothetical protein
MVTENLCKNIITTIEYLGRDCSVLMALKQTGTAYIKCVSLVSTTFVGNMFRSGEHLASYSRDACKPSRKLSVIVARF